jgi:Glycosyltransferase family 28 C-terminal domain
MAGNRSYDYDLAILGDFRYPGGTSVSLAEELKAQTSGGYTTALVPMRTPQLKRARRFHPQLISCIQAGMGEVVAADSPVRVKLLVIRHPALFTDDPEPRPRIRADRVVMVANQPPVDRTQPGSNFYYDVAAVDGRLHELFGEGVLWTPIGPEVRQGLNEAGVELNLAAADWHNVLDADEWRADRSSFVSDRPVLGRHARPHWKKWPASAEQVLAAYPDDEAVEVKILGGGEVAAEIIGRVPANWTLYPFNSLPPRRFLREIDFEVYYHHPGWIEAFGRTVVEGLASAAPTIVPPHFERLFEDACVYAEPEQVLETVWRHYQDPALYRDRAERGHQFVRDNFSHEVHRARIAALAGEPSNGSRRTPAVSRRLTAPTRVIFFAANGSGLGHVTRALAIARRLPEEIEPVFVTLSGAMRVIREAGYLSEYIPQGAGPRWQRFLEQRLTEILAAYEATALVFDSAPFTGLTAAKLRSGLPFVWIRRAMWQPGRGGANLAREGHFDLVIEPGELASESDRGLTAARRDQAVCVPPIVLLDESELLERDRARSDLGLDGVKLAVLVQLGPAGAEEGELEAGTVVERLLAEPELELVVADSPLARRRTDLPDQVNRLGTYPVSRYLRAFDFAISAAGYNSFHELVGFGLPTIFVPRQRPLDDQHARSRFADQAGAGLGLEPVSAEGLEGGLVRMRDAEARRSMARRGRNLFPGNGAAEAAAAVARLVGARRVEVPG